MYTVRLRISNPLDDEQARWLAEGLVNMAFSSAAMRSDNTQGAPWVIEWIIEEQPDPSQIIARLSLQAAAYDISAFTDISPEDLEIEEISEDINWLEKSYKEFTPFSVGPFFIHGSHYDGKAPENKTHLQIDAATAFGSGEHETTNGCLLGMLDLKEGGFCPSSILDMGTGSGILALAASKLWGVPILGVDNEAESIRVTKRHADMNNVERNASGLSTAVGDGFHTPLVHKRKPYTLILANILAGPVIEMAPSLSDCLDKNGHCVLSGMLNEQSNLVLSAYEGEGLTYCTRYDIGEWTTLVLRK